MQGRLRRRGAGALAAAAGLLLSALPAAGDGGREIEQLRRDERGLAARSTSALLELYALESSLARARSALAAQRGRAAAVALERADARRRLRIARVTFAVAQRRLAERLLALYEHGPADPVAIVLGATSLDDAMETLDGLTAIAEQDRRIVLQTRVARSRLARLEQRLAAREAALRRSLRAAEERAATLARARTERAAFLARLAAQRGATAGRLAALEDAAARARRRTAAVAAERTRPASTPAEPLPAPAPQAPAEAAQPTGGPASARTLTVTATAYAIAGVTATGIPTGWGVVAVDPSVIPLGSRLEIPGYGEGVAADTGGAVRGLAIDVWFPTRAQALAWGRRTVTITVR